jgi:hypothetical protein
MATEVDICNLALAHLGDTATVASLDPPEGSAQAEHCARFYPIARDGLLEMYAWGFATKRVQLALLTNSWTEWDYTYAQPSDTVNIIAVLPPSATDDYSQALVNVPVVSAGGSYVPQPFSCEINNEGTPIILTDQEDAVLRYTALVSDTGNFSPLFITTLSWYLASMLAGPLIRGDAGAAEAKRCLAMVQNFLSQAMESDASQRRVDVAQKVGWIQGR